jgi:hypothetical protein
MTKKSKSKAKDAEPVNEELVGKELDILTELLETMSDFEYEELATYFDGGLEFKRIKVLSLKAETNENGGDNEPL